MSVVAESIIAAKAKAKQISSGGAVRQKSDEPAVNTKHELAKLAGVSHDTIHKAKELGASEPVLNRANAAR